MSLELSSLVGWPGVRVLAKDLFRAFSRSDTVTARTLHSIPPSATQAHTHPKPSAETVLALMRAPEAVTLASGSSRALRSAQAAEREFGERVVEERARVQVETLSNVGKRGVRRASLGKGGRRRGLGCAVMG